ncbi:hypothetical protein [Streptomyces sp. NPDC050504]|uniref:hypothetical protein n=1 Tax=Streptomyces sp. NPDC050504 TaxID=3365618 RepID=UPI00378D25A5
MAALGPAVFVGDAERDDAGLRFVAGTLTVIAAPGVTLPGRLFFDRSAPHPAEDDI